MKGKNMKFVYTKNIEMADELTRCGFPFICKSGDYYVFENKNELNFSFDKSSRDLILTNRLAFQRGFA